MIRMPVTLADLQGARYKSSLANFKKHFSSYPSPIKLTALREAFAKALGYGTEAELRFVAKKFGHCYTDAPLPVAHVIASVSQRIARQWSVTAEFADTVASSLGLQHFDACRATPRTYPRKPDWSKAVIQVPLFEPVDLQTSQDEHSASDAGPQSLPSNPIQAEHDHMHTDANHVHSAIDQLMKANPAQSAIDQLMKVNPAQSAIDKVMSVNPAMAKLESIFAKRAITVLDRLYENPQIEARLARKSDEAETEA
ncbi:hypothetical protein [Pseudomonas coronafaciens]|uniref:hypothetical protein n=3 Tax=Pseudomonas coronafaciens TaxID=53409 RepID=UPI000E3E959A|nr:hypothetical protein [Pseudomonas coronafaciens]